jgi:NAD(P)H-flavin reductase/nitrite reductase/ring-hydroxylating ferredoxin subunit
MAGEVIGVLSDFPTGVARRIKLGNGEPLLVYNAGTADPAGCAAGEAAEREHGLTAIGDVCPHKRARLSEGDIEDLGENGGVCVRCPKHRRKFNGGGLYFSLVDGSSHVHGDSSSCRKYDPEWIVPTYVVSVGDGDVVLVTRCGANVDDHGSARQSSWDQWAISRVQRCSEDSAIYHFGRLSPAGPQAAGHDYDRPSSWHVAMRLRYTKRPGGKQKKVVREYTPLSSLREWAAGTMRILIKIYATGKLTRRLAQMEVGGLLEFSAPEATLRLQPSISLPDAASAPVAQLGINTGTGVVPLELPWSVGMVAGGTGIAPIWQLLVAMSLHPDAFGGPGISARLVYSNRRREDILLRSELAGLVQEGLMQKGKLDFKVLHTLTGAGQQGGGWDETVGRINEEMLRSMLPGPSPQTVVVICGPMGMNESALRILRGIGYAEHMLIELEA